MCQMSTDFQPPTPQQRPQHSRYRGVTWDKRDGKWRVRISCLGVQHNIGRYFDQEQAARVYDKMAYTLYGNAAITNFGVAAAATSTCRVPQFIHRLRAKLDEWTVQQQQQQLRQVPSSLPFTAMGTAALHGASSNNLQQLMAGWSPSAAGALLQAGQGFAPATPGRLLANEQLLQSPSSGGALLLTTHQQGAPAGQMLPPGCSLPGGLTVAAPNALYPDLSVSAQPVWSIGVAPNGNTTLLDQARLSAVGHRGTVASAAMLGNLGAAGQLQPLATGADSLPAWAKQLPGGAACGNPLLGTGQPQLSSLLGLLPAGAQQNPQGPRVLGTPSVAPTGPALQAALDGLLDPQQPTATTAGALTGALPPSTPGRPIDQVDALANLEAAVLLNKQQQILHNQQQILQNQQQLLQGLSQTAAQQQVLDAAGLAAAIASLPQPSLSLMGPNAAVGNAGPSLDALNWGMNGLTLA